MCVFVSCQFVVRHGHDYAVHAINPDTLVEWGHIEQVVSINEIRQYLCERCALCINYMLTD